MGSRTSQFTPLPRQPTAGFSANPASGPASNMHQNSNESFVLPETHFPRPPPPSFSGFGDAAKVRKERQQADLRTNIGRNVFDPAASVKSIP
jgi:hypothetical protein